MATYPIAYAQQHLSELMERAGKGEEVAVANDQGITVRLALMPAKPDMPNRLRRRFGRYKGHFSVPDDLFDPMTPEELAEWERPI